MTQTATRTRRGSDQSSRVVPTLLIVLTVGSLLVDCALVRSFGDATTLLVPFSFLAVGWLITRRYPWQVEGRLLLAIALAWGLALATPFDGGWVVAVGLMGTHLVLRFPTGHLPSPRWRWFSRWCTLMIVALTVFVTTGSQITSQGVVNPYYVSWTRPFSYLIIAFPISLIVSAASVFIRFGRSSPVERTQIRWLAAAASAIVLIYTTALIVSLGYDSTHHLDSTDSNWFAPKYPAWLLGLQLLALMSFLLIPAAFGVAILRYHLYDIDRIISRTTSYAIVTGLLLGTYGVVVTVVLHVMPESSNLAVAVATLTAAAVARPAIRRVQSVVDRRFDRARYDQLRTVDAFGKELRQLARPDEVSGRLLVTVQAALQPTTATLWLGRTT
jgi:hypothetical protein